MFYSKRFCLPKHANKERKPKKQVQQGRKVTSKHDKEGKKETRAAIVPKISSGIWTSWLYIYKQQDLPLRSFSRQLLNMMDMSLASLDNKIHVQTRWLTACNGYINMFDIDMMIYAPIIEFKRVLKIKAPDVENELQKSI